jgi:hypothetical protein
MHRLILTLLALVLLPAVSVRADPEEGDDELWLYPDKAGAAAAAQVVGVGDPFTAAALRLAAFDADLWFEPPPRLDKVPALNRGRLDKVKDDAAFANFATVAPEEIPREALAEDAVFWQAVAYAAKVPAEVFAAAARGNRQLTFGHLYTEPAKYRGAVVHFEGRLQRLKRLDPPAHAQRKGVAVLYEAWIFLDQPGTHPICVLVPHKPAGLQEGDNLRQRVAVDGYFFKRYQYISGRLDENKNNVALNTLALIAPTLVEVERPAGSGWGAAGSATWLGWIFGFVGGVVVLLVGLAWWFRRNDRKVRARLQAVRDGRLGGPEPFPAEPSVHTNGTPPAPDASKG